MKRDFPLLAVEIKTLLDNFRHERVEEKEKEREKEELAAMEQQLVVCQQKWKKILVFLILVKFRRYN